MQKVNILMSTYNGEKYIGKQLDSLMKQTYESIDIYIRDDGSTDHTFDIINEYQAMSNDNKKIIIVDNANSNLGYPDCFWYLLRNCKDADFYAFCDQDDVWLPGKIEAAVNRLTIDSEPQLYTCSFWYCNSELKKIKQDSYIKDDINFRDVLFYTTAPGFTMVINHAMRKKILEKKIEGNDLIHDRYIQWIASCFGKTIYDRTPYVYYRRYDAAVTSANDATVLSIVKFWIKEEIFGKAVKKENKRIQVFKKFYLNELDKKNRKLLSMFSNKRKVSNWFKKVFYPHKFRPFLGSEIALRILFIFGRL